VMTPWVKGLPGSIRQVRLTTLRDDSSMNCELTDKEAQ